jgi:hypothetical protein
MTSATSCPAPEPETAVDMGTIPATRNTVVQEIPR